MRWTVHDAWDQVENEHALLSTAMAGVALYPYGYPEKRYGVVLYDATRKPAAEWVVLCEPAPRSELLPVYYSHARMIFTKETP